MIFHGLSMSLFHAAQQRVTMSPWSLKMRLESELSVMSCQKFSTGFSSGERSGRNISVTLSGSSFGVTCHATGRGSARHALRHRRAPAEVFRKKSLAQIRRVG